jgi:septal ring factor EnvC (AmiA/AmiB activator)
MYVLIHKFCFKEIFIFICFVCLFLFPIVAEGERQDEAKIKALEERLSAEREKLEASYTRERDLVAEIELLDKNLKLKKEEVWKVKERIRENRQEHRAIAERRGEIEKEATLQRKAVSEKLASLYKHARLGYARILFEVEEIDLLRRAVKYAACMIEEDMKVLETHASAMRKYEREKSVLEADLSKKEKTLASEEKTLAALESNMKDIVLKLVNIDKEKKFYKIAIEELELASEEFKNTMTAIEKRASGEAALEPSQSDLIGAIPLPADGTVIVPSAGRPGEELSGVFIDVQAETEVQAVLPGKVEFSGLVKGYGQTVIVNHGGMLYSISSYLGRRNVSEGKTVKAGDIVGVAGKRGEKDVVYFEIRHGGHPLDVRSWLNVK